MFASRRAASRHRAGLRDRSLRSTRGSVERRRHPGSLPRRMAIRRRRPEGARAASGRRRAGRRRSADGDGRARWRVCSNLPGPSAGSRGRGARQAPDAREVQGRRPAGARRSSRCRSAPIRCRFCRGSSFPAVLKPTVLSGSRGVIRADDAAELRDGVRSHPPPAGVSGRAGAARSGSRRHPDRAVHSRRRVRARGPARARHAADARDLRQARSARGPVLRGNDLRHAVAGRTPAIQAQIDGGGDARGAGARPVSRSDSRRVPRQQHGASTCSKSRRGRLAGCARRRCASSAAGERIGFEDLLLLHAAGEPTARLAARAPAPRR